MYTAAANHPGPDQPPVPQLVAGPASNHLWPLPPASQLPAAPIGVGQTPPVNRASSK